jgi:hypothetical protein
LVNLRRIWNGSRERHRHFLEGDDAVASQMAAQPPQRGGWVGLIHEDKSTDYCIELFLRGERIDFGRLETHERLPRRGGSPARNVERLGGAVDAAHRAGRADHGRG